MSLLCIVYKKTEDRKHNLSYFFSLTNVFD